jgi:Kef-type K+ transport system membrane component KefB
MTISFTSVAVVAVVALVAPLAVAFTGLRLPAVVLEILLGIVVGPQVLGWASNDEPVQVLSLIGLAFLLLLAGLEIDFERLRGRLLRITGGAWLVSFVLALAVGYLMRAGDLVRSPLLVAIILSATGLGVILPILKDAGETSTPFGQVVVAGASIAEVSPIVLLSIFFSGEAGGIGAKLVLLVGFGVFIAAVGFAILGLERSMRVSETLVRLQDTTAEIRVRGAFLLLAVFVVLASKFGLEAILGAFLAGATLKLVDRDEAMTHAFFHAKLEAIGFGVFIPFFFVSTGIKLDVASLFHGGSTIARVPLFLAALLVVRAVPALFYRPLAERRSQVVAGGLLQATSLSIPVVAGQIGVEMGLIRPANYVALVTAGLISVVVFPLVSLGLLRSGPMRAAAVVTAVAAMLAFVGAGSAADRGTVTVGGSSYGRVLFDGRGFVLYAFTRDGKGKSRCYGACAAAWPPYVVKRAPATTALLGTTRRSDGSLQVTYGGRPLYYYAGDRSAGQILCQNVAEYGGTWLVMRASGSLVR